MIYLLSLAWCLWLAWMYDVLGYTKNKWNWYYLLLIWFICISGFQYMVGADIPRYMDSYQHNYNKLRFDIDKIGGQLQPGWFLLNYLCRQITDDFVFFKLIQAIFVNVAIFSFFRRETKYVFLCITIYAITTYLIFNFNSLRQSFAIGFMLYYLSYLKRDRYGMAFISLFAAFMFHNSALIGLIIPLFKFLKYDKRTIIILLGLSILFVVFLIRLDIDILLRTLIDSGYLGDGLEGQAGMYANSQRLAPTDAYVGTVRYIQLLMIISTVFYYIWKKRDVYVGGIGLIYLFLQVMDYSFPIMFRFRQYFDMYFYVMFSFVILDISAGRYKQIRRLIIVSCLLLISFFPTIEYLRKYPGSHYRYIDQYYPYHSVFNPDDVDYKKNNYMKWL